jgi:hypothetical protein
MCLAISLICAPIPTANVRLYEFVKFSGIIKKEGYHPIWQHHIITPYDNTRLCYHVEQMLSCGSLFYQKLMLSCRTKCYHLCYHVGRNVIMWDQFLSWGTKCYHLCYHVGWNIIIWGEMFLLCRGLYYYVESYVIMWATVIMWNQMLSSGAFVIMWDQMLLCRIRYFHLVNFMLQDSPKI